MHTIAASIDPAARIGIHHAHFQIGYTRYVVGHAPDGGRKEFGGPITEEAFCWVNATAAMLTRNPIDRGECPTLAWGDVIEIVGYGCFHLIRPNAKGEGRGFRLDGDHPRLRHVDDPDEGQHEHRNPSART